MHRGSVMPRRVSVALFILAAAALATGAASAAPTGAPTGGADHPIVRFRPVLAELPAAGGPESVTQAEADSITFAIASCDPSAVLALRVVSTATAADDVAASCVVLPTSKTLGNARLYLGPARLDASDIASARSRRADGQGYLVDVTLTKAGKRRFNKLTAEVFRKKPPRNQLAITVNSSIVFAPTVRQKRFPDGALSIAGNLTRREARDLAAVLSSRSS